MHKMNSKENLLLHGNGEVWEGSKLKGSCCMEILFIWMEVGSERNWIAMFSPDQSDQIE